MVFRWFYKVFGPLRASKLDLNFELSWRSSWEASWGDVGRVLGGQDAPQTAQDGAKTLQDGAKTAQDGAKTGQGGAKTPQNSAKTLQDGAETGPRASRHTNIEKPKVQDVLRTLQKD